MHTMNNAKRIESIEQRLTAALQPTRLDVIDDSARHKGHAGAKDGRGHFIVKIESKAFAGKSTMECHRLVYAAVGDMMQTDIHALSISTQPPD